MSMDGTGVAISLPGAVGVFKLPGLEPAGRRRIPRPSEWGSGGAADSSIVTVANEGVNTLLLDARTGEALARIVEGRAGAGASQVNLLPSLRHRLSRGARSWALTPMPGPDTTSPAESLRRALAEGGFRLRGVDLEVVSP